MDIASSEPHQRHCSRLVSDAKQLLNNGASLEGWRRMNAGGEFWSHSGGAAVVLSNSHASMPKSCLKTHLGSWETQISENRHMSEAMKELSVFKHFSFHTAEVFSNTSQGSVREKSCHREGSVWTQFTLYVWKCVQGLDGANPQGYFNTAGRDSVLTKLCNAIGAVLWHQQVKAQNITAGALYCPIRSQNWYYPFL